MNSQNNQHTEGVGEKNKETTTHNETSTETGWGEDGEAEDGFHHVQRLPDPNM